MNASRRFVLKLASMKHSFFAGAFLALLVGIPLTSHAAAPGSLIKGSGPSVYYLGEDAKRYVFPTQNTYATWYANFSGVQTISDQELQGYILGGNVTYRPGVRLVKITTDPRVYAVGRGGVLRWVETEAIARALYGDNWARQVDDIPDAFFINYRIGASIHTVGDFSPATERDAVTYIGANRAPTTSPPPSPVPTPPPSPTPSPIPTSGGSNKRVLFEISPSVPRFGTSVSVRAEVTPSHVTQLKLYYNDTLQRTCEYYICSMSIDLPLNSSQSTFPLRAEVRFDNGDTLSQTHPLVPQTGSQYLLLQVSRADIEPAGTREVIARATSDFSARFIDIYLDGGVVKGCVDQQECRYSALESSPVGTVHSVYMVATDRNGRTARSETQRITVVANDSPAVGITVGKTLMLRGETVDVRVMAADDDGVQEINIAVDGRIVKTCTLSICDAVLGPWTEARIVEVMGHAKDRLGAQSSATSSAITVR